MTLLHHYYITCFFINIQLHPDIIDVISEVTENHVDLMSVAAKSDRFEEERVNILKNIDYVFQEFLPLVESKIQVSTNHLISI